MTGVVNFVLKDDFEGIEGNIQTGLGSDGDAWRINGDLTWGTTYLDSMGLRAVEIEAVGDGPNFQYTADNALTDSTFIHDISFSYDVNDMFDVYGGVNNVFNKRPFVTEQAYPVSLVGSFFYLGARVTL